MERKKNEEIAKENIRKQKLIEEEARKKGIEIEKLDRIMDECGSIAKVEGIGAGAFFLLALGGIALTAECPLAGPAIAVFCFAGSLWGGAVTAGCGIVAAGAKIAKEIKK
jgi:hypothetical protein